ncbi:MAG: helix-turn-helix transcriptional regulator [Ardenticatenaceae bacterium]|nr:helix-turn-helix transcriptional regulator [Ardenticatenaceae bacterium]
MKRFGEKLRMLRTTNNMTLIQLAEKLGYTTHSYLSEIEYGRKIPTVSLVLKVATLFNVTTDELLKDELDLRQIQNETKE